MAQVSHATTEFAWNCKWDFLKWYLKSKYIVVLAVKDLEELTALRKNLKEKGLKVVDNYEPDLGNQLTAIAISPSDFSKAKKLVRHIPLAFAKGTKDVIVVHFNKKHNEDPTIPQWVVKHKGTTYYVKHIEFKNVCFSSKETPDNAHTKGSLKFHGKLTITGDEALIE